MRRSRIDFSRNPNPPPEVKLWANTVSRELGDHLYELTILPNANVVAGRVDGVRIRLSAEAPVSSNLILQRYGIMMAAYRVEGVTNGGILVEDDVSNHLAAIEASVPESSPKATGVHLLGRGATWIDDVDAVPTLEGGKVGVFHESIATRGENVNHFSVGVSVCSTVSTEDSEYHIFRAIKRGMSYRDLFCDSTPIADAHDTAASVIFGNFDDGDPTARAVAERMAAFAAERVAEAADLRFSETETDSASLVDKSLPKPYVSTFTNFMVMSGDSVYINAGAVKAVPERSYLFDEGGNSGFAVITVDQDSDATYIATSAPTFAHTTDVLSVGFAADPSLSQTEILRLDKTLTWEGKATGAQTAALCREISGSYDDRISLIENQWSRGVHYQRLATKVMKVMSINPDDLPLAEGDIL